MKGFKRLFVFLLVLLCITGCSFEKDKEDNKEKKNNEPVATDEPLEISPELFNYTGSFVNKAYNYTLDVYVSANSDALSFDFTIPGSGDATVDENGEIHASFEGGQSISFTVREIENDTIIIKDEFLGLKGDVKKTDKGYVASLIMGDASEAISLSGEYEPVETKGNIKGYYSNGDYKAIAITPLKDSVLVSTALVEEGFYTGGEYMCEFTTDTKISCTDEDIKTITQTEDGKIKVDSNNKKIKGEYVVNLNTYEKE